MINGLGVVGWGVGGIEAEACMLGQPVSMLLPPVVGFRLHGRLREGVTATDLVLTVTQMLRKKGVVGKFVEFYGDGLSALSLADRATVANMAPEYGATIGLFPIDDETLRYLRLTNRPPELVALVEAYAKEQGLFRTDGLPEPALFRTPGAGSFHGRAVAGRTEAAAGPHRPSRREEELPDFPGHAPAPGGRVNIRRRADQRPGRLGGHRRDHQLHQHLEPVGAPRRRPAGEEGRRARPAHVRLG